MSGLRRFADTAQALRCEEEMLAAVAEAGIGSRWMTWSGSGSLVVPRRLAGMPRFALARARSEAAGWPVHVRATGGDATPQGPGIINLAIGVAMPTTARMSINKTYDLICGPLEDALSTVPGIGRGSVERCFCDGDHNITVDGRKLAGTAQRWRRTPDGRSLVLAHALILFDCDIPASVAAVNALRRDLRLSANAVPGSHVNARTIERLACDDVDQFAEAIGRQVDARLSRMRGAGRAAKMSNANAPPGERVGSTETRESELELH